MKLRHVLTPIARPLIARLARYFVPRSEHEHALALLRQREEAQFDRLVGEFGSLERRAAAQDALISELGARSGRIEATAADVALRMVTAEAQAAALALRVSVLEARAAEVEARSARIERDAGWDRQALHDLVCGTVGGSPDRVGRIGVVMPTCDRPAALERALQSLVLQTVRPEVVVVVNDGAADVQPVLDSFAGRLHIVSLRTQAVRSGSSAARNVGLDVIDTPLVAFLDDDNLMWPRWLERAAQFLDSDPDLDIVYGVQLRDVERSSTDKRWFLEPFDLDRLAQGNFIDLNQVVHRASGIRFDRALRRLVDWDYVLRLIGDAPQRVAAVDAIASVYLVDEPDRISVGGWPPDLNEVMRHRRVGSVLALPGGHCACSCCGFTGNFLPGPGGRPNAACPQCGSLERHRFLGLLGPIVRAHWLPQARPPHSATMLEVAPSSATAGLRGLYGRVLTIDADPEADSRVVDVVASLTHLPVGAHTVDLAVVLHVLEHVPDDLQAMREIARALRWTGMALLQVPLSGRPTTDEEVLDDPDERVARYGQADHVRVYGDDFMARLESAGLVARALTPRESMPSEVVTKYSLAPDEAVVMAVRADGEFGRDRLSAFVASLRKGLL